MIDSLEKLINEYKDPKTMVVIKGFNVDEVLSRKIDLDRLLENRLGYFMRLESSKDILTYDEYLALREFIFAQYPKVIIIDNNLYENFYPLCVNIKTKIQDELLSHYNSEIKKSGEMSKTAKAYTEIYSNFVEIGGKIYNTFNQFVDDEKERTISFYEECNIHVPEHLYSEGVLTYDLLDELDYLQFLDKVLTDEVEKIQIVKSNVGLDIDLLKKKISILSTLRPDLEMCIVKKAKETPDEFVHPDFRRILKQYWRADNFKPIQVYDMDSIADGKREIENIKQSDVISHLVEQVERCKDGESFRDIFVTAPTGAGKSAMFQIPAIYLAENYGLFTIVISPLIGLMNDQVNGLESRGYKYSRTINSDISPIKKQEIIDEIAEAKCNVLYLSPESLMGKSDLMQIIGPRKLGVLVIDEAHIVTTWGKQFRPDYWYLGDHIMKLRKSQQKREGMQFVIATFTATAIFGGLENMYQETIQSLHMIDPITYLGYVRRDDISITVNKREKIKNRSEYELDKFDLLIKNIKRSIVTERKTLIYFPTVALIERFHDYCKINDVGEYVAKYHGRLDALVKQENYIQFLNKEKPIMIATKAFGMGIDIEDIEIVMHFAPTGNVCDYMQEIGRAARKPLLKGNAVYDFMSNDFKHINRLHGLSTVKEYQLVEVIKKIYQLHNDNIRRKPTKRQTKRSNEMLVDAESFSHIFENAFSSPDDGISKVKTAMLLIQKDFERSLSYSPFYVRPIPLFEIGYFKLSSKTASVVNNKYGNIAKPINEEGSVFNVNLKQLWERQYSSNLSFPKFKYMLYSKDRALSFDYLDAFDPVLKIDIDFKKGHQHVFKAVNDALSGVINNSVREGTYIDADVLADNLHRKTGISRYRVKSIVEINISAMRIYAREYCKNFNSNPYSAREQKSGVIKYRFKNAVTMYFNWIKRGLTYIEREQTDNELYLNQGGNSKKFKEYLTILGVLESYDVLSYKALGGRNSQLYIYINQTKTMKEIINRPYFYHNQLLEIVGLRHKLSVGMLTYLFDNGLSSDEIWNILEDYFIGIIPDEVATEFEKSTGRSLRHLR
ncbi:ATP-dependent DNA helicase RecQ [Clostridia bacterium]|nr:ATP-dependent DNA helicase RecQ [Clostridia bacterium]